MLNYVPPTYVKKKSKNNFNFERDKALKNFNDEIGTREEGMN